MSVRSTDPYRRLNPTAIPYLFILPVILFTVFFKFIPIGVSLLLSFTEYDMLSSPRWVGIANYAYLLSDNDLFWTSLKNTAQYSLEVLPANIAISLLLAILVNQELKGVAFFRTVFYLPVVTSIIAVSMIWMWIYNYQVGLLNSILGLFGLGPFDWLRNPKLALHSLAIMRVWKGVGWNMVIYLAGLQGIPRYIYEAATIDGASAWTQFRRLTWPLLRPVTYYIIVMGLISTFQSFGEIYAMTQGGPLDSTTTLGYLVYQQAFQYWEMGKASATAFILFGVIFALSIAQNKFVSAEMN
ncbi:MAG: sugar ABC transporter permease [Firmicutes bacterium]|nr:sugar ABC transporter permease [Bacillota bacterium]